MFAGLHSRSLKLAVQMVQQEEAMTGEKVLDMLGNQSSFSPRQNKVKQVSDHRIPVCCGRWGHNQLSARRLVSKSKTGVSAKARDLPTPLKSTFPMHNFSIPHTGHATKLYILGLVGAYHYVHVRLKSLSAQSWTLACKTYQEQGGQWKYQGFVTLHSWKTEDT